jgi:hypothetical protein
LGLRRGRLGDDIDSVGEFHTCDQLWQLIVTIEAAPAFLRGLDELKDHRELRQRAARETRADLRPRRGIPGDIFAHTNPTGRRRCS